MCRVRAASRLHFGLLSLPGSDQMPAERQRQYGGAGLMIRHPGICLRVQRASTWSAEGPLAERALAFARRFAQASSTPAGKAFHIQIEESAPEHSGLGTGTQLGLAVAKALAGAGGRPNMEAAELARCADRGQRSSLGIHGFATGGFMVDGGKGPHTSVAPLIARLDFPADWHIVLVLPRGKQGLHGLSENAAFGRLQQQPQECAILCRLVLLGMLPALAEADLPAFGEALYEFNRRVGEMFRPFQGGTYAHPATATLVDLVRRQGVPGVGQSSWGPATFAVVEKDRGAALARSIRAHFGIQDADIVLTQAENHGAQITW